MPNEGGSYPNTIFRGYSVSMYYGAQEMSISDEVIRNKLLVAVRRMLSSVEDRYGKSEYIVTRWDVDREPISHRLVDLKSR